MNKAKKMEVTGVRLRVKEIREELGLPQSVVANDNYYSLNGYRLAFEQKGQNKIDLNQLSKLADYFSQCAISMGYSTRYYPLDLLEEYQLTEIETAEQDLYIVQKRKCRKQRSEDMTRKKREARKKHLESLTPRKKERSRQSRKVV